MPDAPALTVMPPMAATTPVFHDTVSPPVGDVRLLRFAALGPDELSAWAALDGHAGGDEVGANIFAQSWVLAAGLRQFGDDVWLAFVRNGSGGLIGVVPLMRASKLGRFPLDHWQVWNHPNSFCAPVLIRKGEDRLFWDLLLSRLPAASQTGGACAIVVADCPFDSSSFESLGRIANERGLALAIVEQHERALAVGHTPLEEYWDTHVRAKKRKELRRQAARLAEMGAVTVEELGTAEDAAPWIDEFLALEQLGWKGAAGSALAAAPGTAAYFREVVTAAHGRGRLSLLALRLDGRAIAMLVTLFDGDAAFSFKTAYDEDLSRFSPGVQIQRDNLAVLAARGVQWADSCAAADHPMIDSIWAQRRTIGTVVVGLPGTRNRLTFAAYRAALASWRTFKHVMGRRP